MALPHEHMGPQTGQLVELQIPPLQNTADEVLRHVGDEDHAQVALLLGHLLDDSGHLHLLEADLDAWFLPQMQELHKGLGAEGIALGGDGQGDPVFRPALAVVAGDLAAALHNGDDLVQQLPAVLRQRHAPVGAVENGDAQLLFHLGDGAGQGGLGHEQVLGRPVDGAAAVDLQNVAHLQQCHGAHLAFLLSAYRKAQRIARTLKNRQIITCEKAPHGVQSIMQKLCRKGESV